MGWGKKTFPWWSPRSEAKKWDWQSGPPLSLNKILFGPRQLHCTVSRTGYESYRIAVHSAWFYYHQNGAVSWQRQTYESIENVSFINSYIQFMFFFSPRPYRLLEVLQRRTDPKKINMEFWLLVIIACRIHNSFRTHCTTVPSKTLSTNGKFPSSQNVEMVRTGYRRAGRDLDWPARPCCSGHWKTRARHARWVKKRFVIKGLPYDNTFLTI